MEAKIITWQEIAETFTIIDGELWRKLKSGKLKQLVNIPDTRGYVKIRCHGSKWQYHRLLYMLYHKVTLTATQVVDHIIEGNKSDNRIENLQVINNADNRKKSVIYRLPKRDLSKKLILAITVNKYRIHIGQFLEEATYWAAHAKMLRLFGVGTKGLAFAQSLNRADAKEFVQLAMVA